MDVNGGPCQLTRAHTAPMASPSKTPRLPTTPLSRPGTQNSGLKKMKNLPIIEHPQSRMGDRNGLNIQGSMSRLGHHDDFSFGGRGSLAELPPVGRRMYSSVDELSAMDWADGMKPERRIKKHDTIENQLSSRYGPEMLEALVREKLAGNKHGIKHMFKSSDPNGNGTVSREALLRILSSLCGYITPEQLNKLMKNMGLGSADKVSFEHFINYFHDDQSVHQQEWISPISQLQLQTPIPPTLEDHLLCYCLPDDHFFSAGFSNNLMKEYLQNGTFDARQLLPPSCFAPGGMIIQPHLRMAVEKMGLRITEDEFAKLWDRYDLNGTNAITPQVFFRLVGLDHYGRPKYVPHRIPIHLRERYKETSLRNHTRQRSPQPVKIPTSPLVEGPKEEKPKEEEVKCEEEVKKEEVEKEVPTKKKVDGREDALERQTTAMKQKMLNKRIKFECVMDMLHYRFEEAYMAMLKTFELFDGEKDGHMARVDFRKVMKEFGFPISAMDLEGFMAKLSLRSIQGMVNYKNFLWKFQNRASAGLVNQVLTNENHVFQERRLPVVEEEYIPIDQLEARLVEFFHRDFLKLLVYIKKADKYDLGVVPQYELRNAVEKVLNLKMTEKQWAELREAAQPDQDGLVNYNAFMEIFNAQPGTWNRKLENGYWLTKVDCHVAPPELKRLKEAEDEIREIQQELAKKKEEEKKAAERRKVEGVKAVDTEKEKRQTPTRSLEDLYCILEELFRNRFHSVDKAFKMLDRKYTGRIDKEQFRKILSQCQVDLTEKEMEEVWMSLKLARDGMYSYRTLIYQFMTKAKQRGPPPIKGKLPMKSTKEAVTEMKKVVQEKKEADVKAAVEERKKEEVKQAIEKKTDPVLEKIRKDVLRNWDRLKSVFKLLDKDGYASVMQSDLLDVYRLLHINVSLEDQEHINSAFCRRGRFYYIPFMQYYIDPPTVASARITHPVSNKKMSHKLEKKLMKEWKNIRRAFRKLDPGNHGYLEAGDFRNVLRRCKINVSEEDFFHIMCDFDTQMNGKISYENFLAQILTTY